MFPMSPWGKDHLFGSPVEESRLAYGLWGFQESRRFSMVHGFDDPSDVGQTIHRQVGPPLHHPNDRREPTKVIGFRRSQWIRLEEGNHALQQVSDPEDLIGEEILPVVVVPAIAIDPAAPEPGLDELQDMGTLALNNREHGLQLPPHSHLSIALDRTTEATFTVDEADDPLLESWPFLLIARTLTDCHPTCTNPTPRV
jgi:hypothetical protein